MFETSYSEILRLNLEILLMQMVSGSATADCDDHDVKAVTPLADRRKSPILGCTVCPSI